MRLRVPVLILFVCALGILAAAGFGYREKTGLVQLTVLDGRTDEPLQDAVVVIPEINQKYRPDAAGRTEEIMVPVRRDERFDGILTQGWGEITVLAYCEGYYPLALFHLKVSEGAERGDLTLYLFPDDGSLKEPFTLCESPESAYVRELLTKYAP